MLLAKTEKDKDTKLALLFIVICAAILRIPNVFNGLPFFVQVEEGLVNNVILNLSISDLNPHDFIYPGLIYYLMLPIFSFFRFIFPHAMSGLNLGEFFSYILLGRIVIVFMGLCSIVFLYRIGKRLFDPYTALIAALFLATDPMYVAWSSIFKPDMLMSTLIIVAFLFICRISNTTDTKRTDYIFTGLFIGLATAAKYNALITVIPFLLVHLFNLKNKAHFMNKNLFLALFFMCLGFFIFNPFIILDSSTFLKDIKSELYRAKWGFPSDFISDYRGWVRYPLIVTSVLGPGMLTLSICGLILSMLRHTRNGILILSFPLAYYLIMGAFRNSPAHYALPIIPFILLLAAKFLKDLIFSISKMGLFKKIKSTTAYLIILGSILPSLYRSIYYIKWINQEDTKILARDWMQANIPSGSRVLADIFSPDNPAGIPGVKANCNISTIKWREKLNYRDFFSKNNFDYIIIVCIEDRPLNEQQLYDYINQRFLLIKEFKPRIKRPTSHFMYSPLYHSTIRIYDGRKQKIAR